MTTLRRSASLALLFVGVVLLTATGGPILWSEINYTLSQPPKLIDPTGSSFSDSLVDYTLASTWFDIPPASAESITPPPVQSFSLSIPSLKLTNIPVVLNSTDLKSGPILYPSTSYPGQFGNPVIFGHSTLASLYKPSDPFSIFNPLPQIKLGEDILVTFDRVTYRYVVKHTQEVKPSQVEVLKQRFDRKEITLITCVPLGTYLRRFVVTAELASN